jgi:hypothetical protein
MFYIVEQYDEKIFIRGLYESNEKAIEYVKKLKHISNKVEYTVCRNKTLLDLMEKSNIFEDTDNYFIYIWRIMMIFHLYDGHINHKRHVMIVRNTIFNLVITFLLFMFLVLSTVNNFILSINIIR